MPKLEREVSVYYTVIDPNDHTYPIEALRKLDEVDKYLLYVVPVEVDRGLLAYFTHRNELPIRGFAREDLNLDRVKNLRLLMLNLFYRDYRAFMDKHYFLYLR